MPGGESRTVHLVDLTLSCGEVGADCFFGRLEGYEERYGRFHCWIFCEVFEGGWLWNELLVFHHSFYVHAEGFACELACFFQSFTSSNATGEVRETDSEIGVAVFVQVGDVMHGLLL